MPSIISATTTSGLVTSADNSGSLQLQTNNGTTAVTIDTAQGVKIANAIGVGNTNPTTSGAGITFPATQSASTDANTLDDYEEGTWTPTTSSSGYTISSSSGNYTKIGRIVHLQVSVRFSAVNGSSNSTLIIGGLPFTVGSSNVGVTRDNTTTGAIYVLFARVGETNVEMNSMDGVGNGSQRTIRTNETYEGTVIYQV